MNTDLKLFDSISISSSLDDLNHAEALVDKVCSSLSVNEDYYGNVLIAVTEAVNNAILHGNNKDSRKRVKIDVLCSDSFFEVSVSDEGQGFDFINLPDPTAPENLEKENGRGIFLMKSLAESVDFDDNGRVVKMRFNIN